MNLTLHELAADFRATADLLADMDLPAEVVSDTLESIALPLEQKAERVAMFARNLEATAEQIKQAEAAMNARRKAMETRAVHLRAYLLDNMQRAGIPKIECLHFRIAVRDNPESVVIDDEDAIPIDYKREVPAHYAPNKAAMKAAMNDGFVIPGAHLARTQRIEIK